MSSKGEQPKNLRDYWSDPKNRELMSKKAKIRWSNPEYRDRCLKVFKQAQARLDVKQNKMEAREKSLLKRGIYSYKEEKGKIIKLKRCAHCKKYKTLDEFHKRRGNQYQGWCKECSREYLLNRKYKKNRKEYYNKYHKERVRIDPEYNKYRKSYGRAYYKFGREIAYCSQCKEWKHKSEFYEKRGGNRGVTDQCKECINKDLKVIESGRKYNYEKYFQQPRYNFKK